jgi:hypothetical protein
MTPNPHVRRSQPYRDRKAEYRRRIADGRCARCAEKKPKGYMYATCPTCRAHAQKISALHYARLRNTPRLPRESPRERVPGCRVCGLRGVHECLRGSATERKAWP